MLVFECEYFPFKNTLIYFERNVCFEKKSGVYCFAEFYFNRLVAYNHRYKSIYLFFIYRLFINWMFHFIAKIRVNGHCKECGKAFAHLGKFWRY